MATAQQHVTSLVENLSAVRTLVDIHGRLTGSKRGRRHDVDVLNSSGVVLLVACWESFVEQVAVSAFDFILDNGKDPSVFPAKVLALAGSAAPVGQGRTTHLELAGDGWRQNFDLTAQMCYFVLSTGSIRHDLSKSTSCLRISLGLRT